MAPTKPKSGSSKGVTKRPSTQSKSSFSSKSKKPTTSKAGAKQHKPKPASSTLTAQKKKKPPHLRYTEAQLKIPHLNGIRPSGVQKLPNKKKGKVFVDDGEGMRTILAMVMAEKEGNLESKMMRARQLEEIREAKRAEAEKREESRKKGFEERKAGIKAEKKWRKGRDGDGGGAVDGGERKVKNRVSFG